MARKEKWYWCQEHERAEPWGQACPRDRRLGPYPSKESAENWRDLHEQREEHWEEQDEEWDEWPEDGPEEDSDGAAAD